MRIRTHLRSRVPTRVRRRAAGALLALPLALAAALPPAPAAAGSGAHDTARLHTPAPNPGAVEQIRDLAREGRYQDAVGILRMVRTPQAVWLTGESPGEAAGAARDVVRAAARKGALPVLALYNVPGRDCANYSGGGASNTAEYQAWIDAVARGIGGHRALVVLEPDSLALMPSDCGQDDAEGTLTAARFKEIRYAVDVLGRLPRTKVYLDAGHPGWHSVRSIVPRLAEGGVDGAAGFFLNVSNYQTDAANVRYGTLISACLAHAAGGGDPAHCPDQWTPQEEADAWVAANAPADPRAMKHFVTDSSRNGRGPWTAPAGRTRTPRSGATRRTAASAPGRPPAPASPCTTPACGSRSRGSRTACACAAPPAPRTPPAAPSTPGGRLVPQQALELVRFAGPPIV